VTGGGGPLRADRIELREIRLALRRPFRISSGTRQERRVLLVRMESPSGAVSWSECVAEERPEYSPETVDTAWIALRDWLAPEVLGRTFGDPREVDPALADLVRGHRMARAALEMGFWNLEAIRFGVPLAELTGGERRTVETGISIGIQESPGALVERAEAAARRGYRKIVQNDDDERGRNLPGYYHTATLGPKRIREAFPDHHLPKEVKHYYAREALSMPDDHPLTHPKVGSSLQASLLDDDQSVRWRDIDSLERELDQTVLSVLADAGLDIAPSGDGPFVEDSYFEIGTSNDGPNPIGLDLTRVEQGQESVAVRHLSDGLSPVQWESLEMLVTDGGQVSPADIADEYGRHVESVRRALREM
jgi:hypothetical protein